LTVAICEVGPRDGLQNEPKVLPPAVRAELVERLVGVGVRRLEATSFVHPARVPAMADAEEVVERVVRRPGVVYAGLVLNERGYDRLLASGLDEARVVIACTETFSRRNANASMAEACAAAERIVRRAHADGLRAVVALAVAFGCPFEGNVPEAVVRGLAERFAAMEPDEISLADTIGVAGPREVRRTIAATAALGVPVGVHFHHTRNTAVVNSYAAFEAGAATLESAIGGTGGCPFAPGAQGNVATEDLVYLLHRDGLDTGIELDGLIDVAAWLQERLEHSLPSHLLGVGADATR
jgi:isopropylmalate/homocitrate/citramalate synthase